MRDSLPILPMIWHSHIKGNRMILSRSCLFSAWIEGSIIFRFLWFYDSEMKGVLHWLHVGHPLRRLFDVSVLRQEGHVSPISLNNAGYK